MGLFNTFLFFPYIVDHTAHAITVCDSLNFLSIAAG